MKKGFTLIELLVVIAIIGILSAVVLTSLNSSRERARDASLQAGIKEVAKAVELDRHPSTGNFSAFSNTSAAAIGLQKYIAAWPDGVEYIDNIADNTTYCVSAALYAQTGYFVASEHGSGYRLAQPALGDCKAD